MFGSSRAELIGPTQPTLLHRTDGRTRSRSLGRAATWPIRLRSTRVRPIRRALRTSQGRREVPIELSPAPDRDRGTAVHPQPPVTSPNGSNFCGSERSRGARPRPRRRLASKTPSSPPCPTNYAPNSPRCSATPRSWLKAVNSTRDSAHYPVDHHTQRQPRTAPRRRPAHPRDDLRRRDPAPSRDGGPGARRTRSR